MISRYTYRFHFTWISHRHPFHYGPQGGDLLFVSIFLFRLICCVLASVWKVVRQTVQTSVRTDGWLCLWMWAFLSALFVWMYLILWLWLFHCCCLSYFPFFPNSLATVQHENATSWCGSWERAGGAEGLFVGVFIKGLFLLLNCFGYSGSYISCFSLTPNRKCGKRKRKLMSVCGWGVNKRMLFSLGECLRVSNCANVSFFCYLHIYQFIK